MTLKALTYGVAISGEFHGTKHTTNKMEPM